MFNAEQCELARVMSKSSVSDIQINAEYQTLLESDKYAVAEQVDRLVKEHNVSFDKGIEILQNGLTDIAVHFQISPATLFCVYMENKE